MFQMSEAWTKAARLQAFAKQPQILARVDSGLPVSVKYPKNSKQFQGRIQGVRGPDHPRNDDWTPPISVPNSKDCQEDVMEPITSSSESALKFTFLR